MATLLAYAFENPVDRAGIDAGLERVRAHYQGHASRELIRRGWALDELGVVVWDYANVTRRWPTWAESVGTSSQSQLGVGMTYIPFGSEPLHGDRGQAMIRMARRLADDPRRLAEFDPPFVMAAIDNTGSPAPSTLTLMNDGLGYGRVYQMSIRPSPLWAGRGWVWSNRLGALPVFAGVAPEIDVNGWRYLAAVGWFMDDTTAIKGASQLGPGTVVRFDPHASQKLTMSHVDAIGEWVTPRLGLSGVTKAAVDGVCEHMIQTARSLDGLWGKPPMIHLSGGRDSRAVAAAVICSGIDAEFMTMDNLKGEASVVQRLLAALPRSIRHTMRTAGCTSPTDADDDPEPDAHGNVPLRERVAAHHMLVDAMASPNTLGLGEPQAGSSARAHLSGAGGELAHGHYYPRVDPSDGNFLQRWTRFMRGERPTPRATSAQIAKRLVRKITSHGGAAPQSLQAAADRVDAVLAEAQSRGLAGLNTLEYFYLLERLRRWNNSSMRPQSVTPLVNTAFFRATFDLAPSDRYASAFPTALVASLIPQWKGIPFYRTDQDDLSANPQARIWNSPDADEFEQIILQDDSWHDVLDAATVRQRWLEARAGRGEPRDESVFRRVVWRACFDQHLERLAQSAKGPVAAAAG